MKIERLRRRPGLVDALYAMERDAFVRPWTKRGIASFLEADWYRVYLFRKGGRAIGYALVQLVMDEGELLRFMLLSTYQGRGWASEALDMLLKALEDEGMERIFLEVRQDNQPAMGLYAKAGFEPVGKRKNYYEDGADAYLFCREGGESSGTEELHSSD